MINNSVRGFVQCGVKFSTGFLTYFQRGLVLDIMGSTSFHYKTDHPVFQEQKKGNCHGAGRKESAGIP